MEARPAVREEKDAGTVGESTWRGIAPILKEKAKGVGAIGQELKEEKGGPHKDALESVTTVAERDTRRDSAIGRKEKVKVQKELMR